MSPSRSLAESLQLRAKSYPKVAGCEGFDADARPKTPAADLSRPSTPLKMGQMSPSRSLAESLQLRAKNYPKVAGCEGFDADARPKTPAADPSRPSTPLKLGTKDAGSS